MNDQPNGYGENIRLLDLHSKPLPPTPSRIDRGRRRTQAFWARGARFLPKFDHGYQFGLRVAFGCVIVVFIVNLAFTIAGLTQYNLSNGLTTLQKKDCATVKKTNMWLHLLINVLSTALLAASNYCMQCLSAPTRTEINAAHHSRMWMDIGIPSVRNLWKISPVRRLLWIMLGLSSLPLHLLYNSVFFSTLGLQNFDIFVVKPQFLAGSGLNLKSFLTSSGFEDQYGIPLGDLDRYGTRLANLQTSIQTNSSSFERLSPQDCASTYQQELIFDYGDVLVVTEDGSSSNGTIIEIVENLQDGLFWSYTAEVDAWDCYGIGDNNQNDASDTYSCGFSQNKSNSSDWMFNQNTISYCMAKKVEAHCEMQFSPIIMIVVLVCNVIKGIIIAILLRRTKWQPLVTVGDAVASFLQTPDPTTAGMCLADMTRCLEKTGWQTMTTQYFPRRRFWFSSASPRRWVTVYSVSLIALFGVITLLMQTIMSSDSSTRQMMQIGLGEITGRGLINADGRDHDVLSMVLLANTPQLILSVLYFGYNGLFTCMLLAEEWNKYGRERKALRVSSPEGIQRSTYRLQLPYRFGIPLVVVATLLHWLVSQSIFLVHVHAYDIDGTREPEADLSTCGYSPRATVASISVCSFVLIVGVAFGFHRLNPGIPAGGSCSAVISAACHPPADEKDSWLKKVKWGAVKGSGIGAGERVGQCSFSSREVDEPVPGELYAGIRYEMCIVGATTQQREEMSHGNMTFYRGTFD